MSCRRATGALMSSRLEKLSCWVVVLLRRAVGLLLGTRVMGLLLRTRRMMIEKIQ